MGIYDRDYYQEEEQGRFGGVGRGGFAGGRSLVFNLILLNAAIYVADVLSGDTISRAVALSSDVFRQPWLAWQFLTYGFVHDPHDITHFLFNMLFLWIFGSEVEAVYGKAEFLRIYLTAIVLAGVAWAATVTASGGPPLVGASGGIMCLMILFVLHFPRRLLYIWGVIPVPAWALGTLYVLFDLFGIGANDMVAHVAHLGGAAFGFIYYRAGWNLGRLVPRSFSLGSLRLRKPRLRVHEPRDPQVDLSRQVDRILEKISREGEASLTKSERRTLEEASRRYQRRRT
jgi:membrane associated rhomboid family serine protease